MNKFSELKERYREEDVTMETIEMLSETEGLTVEKTSGGNKLEAYVITDVDSNDDFHVYLREEIEEPEEELIEENIIPSLEKKATDEDVKNALVEIRSMPEVETADINSCDLIVVKFKQNNNFGERTYGKHFNFNEYKSPAYREFYDIHNRFYKEKAIETVNGDVIELVLELY